MWMSKLMTIALAVFVTADGSAGMTCEQCTQIGNYMTTMMSGDFATKYSIKKVQESACQDEPKCQTMMPDLWTIISTGLFGPLGWFSPSYFCKDICPQKPVSCAECERLLNDSLDAMDNEDVLNYLVKRYTDSDICFAAVEEDQEEHCRANFPTYFKTGMKSLRDQDRAYLYILCKDHMKCE